MKILQGIDLVKVERMEQMIERSSGRAFLARVFSAAEQAYCGSKRMKFEHLCRPVCGERSGPESPEDPSEKESTAVRDRGWARSDRKAFYCFRSREPQTALSSGEGADRVVDRA